MGKIRVLVLTREGSHDSGLCGETLEGFLSTTGHFRVTSLQDRRLPSVETLNRFDCLVLQIQDDLNQKESDQVESWARSGKGALLIGGDCRSLEKGWMALGPPGRQFTDSAAAPSFQVEPTSKDHPVTRRIPPFTVEDALVSFEEIDSRWETLLTTNWRGKKRPILSTREEGRGGMVRLALARGAEAVKHPLLQRLIVRSLRWLSGWREPAPIRCGVIGYGGAFDMGKTHAEMILATPGLEFVAACDLDKKRTAAAKRDFPEIRTFTSVKRMLGMEGLDLVTVVTPHHTHGPLAVQCARSGKHVITEKPMCLTVGEADAMIRAGKKKGVMVSVFHNRRWDGDFVTLKRLIEQKAIGEVFQIECFSGGYDHPGWWWRSDKRISGGILYDWGAHFIDWILNLVPAPIESVTGHFQKRHWHAVTNEDHALVVLRFKNGAIASFEQSSLAAAPKDRWRVLGTHGAITLHDWNQERWSVVRFDSGQPVTSQVPFERDDWGAYYRNVADHLLVGEELEVKADQARRIIAVLEGAAKSKGRTLSLGIP